MEVRTRPWAGAYTAIVTPFTKNGEVDFERFKDLIEFQIANGIDGLVPVGTTGESPTLNYAEHERVIEVAIETARKRVKIIAGTGANSTAELRPPAALVLTETSAFSSLRFRALENPRAKVKRARSGWLIRF